MVGVALEIDTRSGGANFRGRLEGGALEERALLVELLAMSLKAWRAVDLVGRRRLDAEQTHQEIATAPTASLPTGCAIRRRPAPRRQPRPADEDDSRASLAAVAMIWPPSGGARARCGPCPSAPRRRGSAPRDEASRPIRISCASAPSVDRMRSRSGPRRVPTTRRWLRVATRPSRSRITGVGDVGPRGEARRCPARAA